MVGDKNTNLIYGGNRTFDAGRLRLMAEAGLHELSVNLLQQTLGMGPSDHLLDVGSGPNAELGDAVEAMGATYTAYDKSEAWAKSQASHGHDAIEGSASNMLLHDNSITVAHLRAANAWFGDERDASWREIIRVGGRTLRGTSIDYDWNVVSGPPELMSLVGVLKPTLGAMGFDHGYGARAEADMTRILTENVGPDNFEVEASRTPLIAETPDQLMKYINGAAMSVINGLRTSDPEEDPAVKQAKLEQAAIIERLLREVQTRGLTPDEVRLPDVVSVLFWLQPESRSAVSRTDEAAPPFPPMTLLRLDDERQVILLEPGWDQARHPLGIRAVDKTHRFYRTVGHVLARERVESDEVLTPEAYEEMHDSKGLRARQDLAVTRNQRGAVIASARLLRPTEEGIISTPTGRRLIEKYGFGIFPEGFTNARVGEIMMAIGGNSEATEAAILACIYAARKADIEKVLYAAVAHKVERHLIDDMFGPIMRPFKVDDKTATVTVTGPVYRKSGIILATGYSDIGTFLPEMIELQRKRNTESAGDIIDYCERLDQS